MGVYKNVFSLFAWKAIWIACFAGIVGKGTHWKKIIPIIEPVKPSSTLLKTLECFVANGGTNYAIFKEKKFEIFEKLLPFLTECHLMFLLQ